MRNSLHILVCLLLILFHENATGQTNQLVIKGIVKEDKNQSPIAEVSVRLPGTFYATKTNSTGSFIMSVQKKAIYNLVFSHVSYNSSSKELKSGNEDTLMVTISLQFKSNQLDTISILAKHLPETLVGKPNYSIYDFDFYEDKLILLTAEKSLDKAQLQLSDYAGKIYSNFQLPKQAGEASHFFHDYEGYSDIVCKDSVFRIDVWNNSLTVSPIKQCDFNSYLKPVADTLNENYYLSNQWDKYPSFNYYFLKSKDSISRILSTVTNEDLMKLYNFEYYFLPSGLQLEARRMADRYKTDKHIIAALMSGFTQSMFYEPLYAPLFVINDTICIFNHHNDFLYHYTKQNKLVDSVKINYHHPKNWREWKKQLFVDETENKVYAFFSKNGHHYLKQINHQNGKEILTYKLQHHSAEKIKIKDGYIYYVYRPFGSTQERFLYRERIE